MAVWVDCSSAVYFGGFAADMGEYTGPWPLMPTAVLDGLDGSHFDEIDFVVGLDNPAHPGDPLYALDGTYDSAIWVAWVQADDSAPTGADINWYTDSSGGADAPGPTDTPPPGCHLWVVGYVDYPAVEPLYPPEHYLPIGYTATGAASTQRLPGGWSAPQPGASVSHTGSVIHETRWSHSDGESTGDEFGSNLTLAQAAVAADIAAAVWDFDAAGDHSFDGVRAANGGPLLPGFTTSAVAAGQRAWSFNPASMVNSTPSFGSLVFGVDYGYEPFANIAYEYLSDPTFTGWATGTIDGITITYYRGRAEAGSSIDMTTAWLVQQLDAFPVDGDPVPNLGTTLLDIPLGGPGTPSDGAPPVPWSVDIPDGAGAPLVLVGTPKFLVDGVDSSFAPEIPATGAAGIYSFIALDVDHDNALSYTYTTGTWRYWIPGGIGPAGAKWHTIAGSWASISGAPMAIFTPGLGPIEYADGPA